MSRPPKRYRLWCRKDAGGMYYYRLPGGKWTSLRTRRIDYAMTLAEAGLTNARVLRRAIADSRLDRLQRMCDDEIQM